MAPDMRVAQMNSVYGHGSTGWIARAIHERLMAEGVTAAMLSSTRTQAANHVRIGGLFNKVEHALETRVLDRHGLASRRPTMIAGRFLTDFRPDVVHLHNVHGYYLNYEVLFRSLRELCVPVVWTLHDSWAYTGHCAYYLYAECDRWQFGCGACPERGSYPKSWRVDRSAKNYQQKRLAVDGLRLTVVTPSAWLAGEVAGSFLRHAEVVVIPNDPDTDVFHPPTEGRTPGPWGEGTHFRLLAVASKWTRRKGLEQLATFTDMLAADERLVVVGELEERALPEHPAVTHIPYTASSAELAAIYGAADLFVNPTLEDNYPTTNLEALACGTPIVTFCSGGSAEALERGPGIAVSDRTAAGLRLAVSAYRSGTALAGGVRSTEPWHGEVDMAGQYLQLYRSLVDGI